MKVNVDNSIVIKFSELINTENFKTQKSKEKFISELISNTSFNKQVDFHKGNWTIDEYFDIVFSVLSGKTITTNNFVLQIIANSFGNVLNKKDVILKKIENIIEYDFMKLQEKLLEVLPINTPLNWNIHIVLDGFNAGSIVDDENMLIDAILWPLDKKKNFKLKESYYMSIII